VATKLVSPTETIVFLGEAGEEPNLAMNLEVKLFDRAGELLTDARTTINSYKSSGLPSSGSEGWMALGRLYSLPWFRRIWTI